jgi:adhesin/invasin
MLVVLRSASPMGRSGMSKISLHARLYLIALATIAVVVACDRIPLTSPTGSSISISIERGVLPLNGQSTVRAVVTESSGTPVHNGTTVVFQPSIGSVSPVEAQTMNGVAVTTFLAGSVSGSGVIHAYSGGARTGSGNASSGGAEVRIGAAAAGGIAVSATPPNISQSGGTVTISALVMDASNNPLPGVSVLFTASNGTLSSTTALSDSNGIARVQLSTVQTSTVTAIAGSAKGETQVVVSLAPAVTITAADTGTEGVPVPITITFTAPSTGAAPQVQSLTVDFGDGFVETRNNVTGSTGFSHTYSRAGGYTITANARDVNGNTGIASKAITIAAAPLPTVSMSVSPNPVPSSAAGLTSITVTAAAGGSSPLRNVTVRNMTSAGEVIYSGTSGGTFAHRFGGTGTYTLQATATDANGNSGTTTTVVVVQ